jgi:two-component system nitrate/nitrite response regulator NarL
MDGLTVLVVADGYAVTDDLNLRLRRAGAVTVLGPVFDEVGARGAVTDGTVDVIVVDLERQDDLGLALVASLRAIAPVPVLVTGGAVDAETSAKILAAGGSGVLTRDAEARRMVEDIRAAAAGQVTLPQGHLSSVVEYLHEARTERRREAVASLTPRELEVLTMLCEGRTPAEAASQLGVSGSTVQAHIRSVFSKLGVHSQVEAVRVAWRCGIGVPVSA